MKSNFKTLVTGGSGFFGKALNNYLNQNDDVTKQLGKIVYTTRQCSLPFSPNYEYEILNIDLTKSNVHETGFTYLIDGATDSTLGRLKSNFSIYNDIQKINTNMIEFVKINNLKSIVFLSSGGVYEREKDNACFETQILSNLVNSENPYGSAKYISEINYIQTCKYLNLNCAIARAFSFIGEDLPLNSHFVIGQFLVDAIKHREININGNKETKRSFMYQSDFARWIVSLLLKVDEVDIVNVGSEYVVTISKLAEIIKQILFSKYNITVNINYNGDNIPPNYYYPDLNKAKCKYSLVNETELEDAIVRTIDTFF